MNPTENINPRVVHQICVQLSKLRNDGSIDGIRLTCADDDLTDIKAELTGPDQTPYEGGFFHLKLSIPSDFPKVPPKAYFTTRVFHPNVDQKTGEVCVNTLKNDWQPSNWSIGNILQVIRCLLIVPFPESALNEEAGRLFMEDYNAYCSYARMLTRIHASPSIKGKCVGVIMSDASSTKKQPLQDSNINLTSSSSSSGSANVVVIPTSLIIDLDECSIAGLSNEGQPSPVFQTPGGGTSISLSSAFGFASPSRYSSSGFQSPFVGSPIKIKRLKSSMRRL